MSERVNDNLDKGKGKIDNVKKKLRKKTSYDKSTQLWKSEEISGDNTVSYTNLTLPTPPSV